MLSRLALALVAVAVGGIAVGACFAALIPGVVEVATAHRYQPEPLPPLRKLAQRSVVLAADGSVLGRLGSENRRDVRFDEIPRTVIDAVVAIEDRTFWTNPGVDVGGVARAALANLTAGRIEQGGSTITQQLVKNRILTNPRRDVTRKLREVEDALRLTKKYTKQKIMAEYLNTVYFGSNSYGVRTAVERFFLTADPGAPFPRPKRLEEVTVGEAALLAGLIANPRQYDPFTQPDAARARRAEVLRAEQQQGYLSAAQRAAAAAEPLPTIPPPPELRPTGYFVETVQRILLDDPRLGPTPEARADALLRGGLTISTTEDPALQAAARAAADERPPLGPDWDAAIVAMEPATGKVRALVGGSSFTASQYDIATHPPGRQPGSTWKMITLAAALQAGYSPADLVDETDPCTVPQFYPLTTVNAEPGSGVRTLREATAESVNCAFVRLSTSVGQDRVIAMAHAMGITQQKLEQILTLTLGTIEATPLEMATVASTIAAGGVRHDPVFVDRVVAPDGTVLIDDSHPTGTRVLDAGVAACEADMLRDVVTGGTGVAAAVPGHTVAGKTGTTDRRSDAWFVGFTPQLTASVWFGNRTGAVPGAGYGGESAAPIFRAFMTRALAGAPDVAFADPSSVCTRRGARIDPGGGRVP